MKFATVRTLKNQTSEILRLVQSGKDVLITSHGKPVAILQGMKEEDLEDYVLSHHPRLRKSIEDAEREWRKKGGISLEEMRRRLKKKERRKGNGRGKLHR